VAPEDREPSAARPRHVSASRRQCGTEVQTTVKALVLDDRGRVLVLREPSGLWDLPGGRLRSGESFAEGLRRECLEEIGLECQVLDDRPFAAWCAADANGCWRAMLLFRAALRGGRIRRSPECVAYRFVPVERLPSVKFYPQTLPIAELLRPRLLQSSRTRSTTARKRA
jgi:8-oxo-dGTP pyrophosphatase MutT (NUDIX family)